MENLAKIGIDWWGMLLYAVNYGLLLFVLARFVYPKITKVIADRKTKIRTNLEDAEKLRKELHDHMQENKKEKEELMSELRAEKALVQKELQDKRLELIQDMEVERNKILEEARTRIESEKKDLILDAEKKIVSMVERVIFSILSNSIPENIVKESVTKSWNSQKSSL